jgi:hypothetical protein
VGSQAGVRVVQIMRADAILRLTSGVRWTPKRRRQGSTVARVWLFQAPRFASYENVFGWTTRKAGGHKFYIMSPPTHAAPQDVSSTIPCGNLTPHEIHFAQPGGNPGVG